MKEWKDLINHSDYELEIKGIKILIKDKVFTPDPKITHSTSMVLNNLPNLKEKEILDIGTGSGIIAISAILNGAKRAIASDTSEIALENAKINIKSHNLEDKITLIQSNLFEKIKGKFDYIFACLPILEEVWDIKTTNLIQKFLLECKNHIKEKGKVFFVWASFSDLKPVKDYCKKLGYNFKITEEEKLGYKWYLFTISF